MDPAAVAPPPEGFTLDAPQSSGVPPPPEGFQLDQSHPPPPEGFTLDQPTDSDRTSVSEQPPQRSLGEEIGRDIRVGLRSAVPFAGGVAGSLIGGGAGALAGSEVPIVGTAIGGFAGGVAGAVAGSAIAQGVQDKLEDALGISTPESRAADLQSPTWATTTAQIIPAAVSLATGKGEVDIATRLATGAITGAVNLVQQGITKGVSDIDPGEAAIAGGLGVALPKARPWLENAVARTGLPIGGSTRATQTGLPEGQGGGENPGGAYPNPAAEATNPDFREAERATVDKAQDVTMTAPGVAMENARVPDVERAEQPTDGLTNAGDGFQSKVGQSGRDLGKGNPATKTGIPGAPKTPLEMLDPDQANMPAGVADAIRGQQGEAPNDRINEAAPRQPEPQAPAPEQNPPQPEPAPQAPVAENPQGPEPAQVSAPQVAENPLYRSSPETQTRTDELARISAAKADADEQSFRERIRRLIAERKATGEPLPPKGPVEEEPQYSDEELDNRIKRQSLSGAATEDMGYGPNAPRAAVAAKNGGLWQRANTAFDKVFNLPRSIFAPHTISDEGMQANRIISKHMGMGKADLAQYQNALQSVDTYFHNMSPADRTSAVTDYENGTIPADHPGRAWMEQARDTSDKLDSALTAAGGTDTYARQSVPSFFEDTQRPKLREDMEVFKQENNRYPTLGEAMKWGFKLKDDLVNADGSPDPQKVVNQQNFAKSMALELQNVMKDARDGWKAAPGMSAADPILHAAPGEGLVKIDPALTGGTDQYAAPEVKSTLERYFNPTIRDGNIKNAYEAYMKLKNADNAISLLGGIYHLRFMFQEAPINEFGQGFARVFKNPGAAVKDVIKAPLAPYTLFKSGKNDVLDAILHPDKVKDPFDKVVNATLKEAGALPPVRVRGMGITPELETGAVKGLATAWKPAFQEYIRDQVQAGLKIGNKAKAGDYLGAGKDTSLATLKAFTEGMQLLMHPMFNTYIPLLKAGANFQNMKRFYIDNPGLSHDQYVAMGQKFVRATDNAMGELNQSTLYAPAYVKAIGNGAMVSLGWNVGDVKQFLGGARAFVRNPKATFSGPDYDPRIMYIPAFIAATALGNIAVQLLHGQGPPKDLTDVAFPRSGGKTKAGNPERIIQPGYEKDVAEAANIVGGPEPMGQNFTKMMYNKLAPLPKTAVDMLIYNKDFAGQQISNPNDPFAQRLADYWKYFEKHALTPIAVQSATQDNNPRSQIGTVEHVLGNRHAPQQWQDPQQYADRIRKQNDKAAKAANTFHQRTGYAEGGLVKAQPRQGTNMNEITLIRHGSTPLNNDDASIDRLRGWQDEPLDENGVKDAHNAADEVAKLPPDKRPRYIATSDLKRAHDTAKVISEKTGIPIVEVTKALRPWDVGKLTNTQTKAALPILNQYIKNPGKPIPSGNGQKGESFNSFTGRAINGIKALQAKHGPDGAFVTHHRVERMLSGLRSDGTVDTKIFDKKGEGTGSVQRLRIP